MQLVYLTTLQYLNIFEIIDLHHKIVLMWIQASFYHMLVSYWKTFKSK